MDGSVVRLGILGCGTVGSALVRQLADRSPAIAARTGLELRVQRIAVHDPTRDRDLPLGAGQVAGDVVTGDAAAVVADPDVDLVVELIGGTEPAYDLVLGALKNGKPVVTANKELIAEAGADLFEAAEVAGVDLLFEAGVGGGIPIIRPLRESLAGERVHRVMGIVNGTTNYVLSRMTEVGADYHGALAEAQASGFAERDPTADVEGHDAAAKAAILATIAFGAKVPVDEVYRAGISTISPSDIAFATRLGYVVKLLAIIERVGEDVEGAEQELAVRVHPTMIPVGHPLASVRDSFNAIFIEGDQAGELMFYGRGAGGAPTASAVLGDIIDAASNLRRGGGAGFGHLVDARVRPMEELVSEYYLTIQVADRPGVLAQVAGVFGDHRVSIRSMEQEGLGADARLVFITHLAVERDLQATLRAFEELEVVEQVGSVLRVAGEEDVRG